MPKSICPRAKNHYKCVIDAQYEIFIYHYDIAEPIAQALESHVVHQKILFWREWGGGRGPLGIDNTSVKRSESQIRFGRILVRIQFFWSFQIYLEGLVRIWFFLECRIRLRFFV